MTKRTRLTDAGILRLRPGGTDYTVWDTVTPGLGVRVRTTGFRGYVFHQRGTGDARRVSLGAVTLKSVADARTECLAIQLNGSVTESGNGSNPGCGMPLFGDYVEDPWLAESRGRWKPSTRRFVDSLLRTKLLPEFGNLRLDRIDPTGVDAWFDRCSATAPGNANKALALLRQIMSHAVANGLIATNAARRARMNPRPRLTRFLSAEEIVRLHEALGQCVAERPSCEGQADILRLLIHTGCRKSESGSSFCSLMPLSPRAAFPAVVGEGHGMGPDDSQGNCQRALGQPLTCRRSGPPGPRRPRPKAFRTLRFAATPARRTLARDRAARP